MNRVVTRCVVLLLSLSWSTLVYSQRHEMPIRYFSEPTLPQDVYGMRKIPIDTGSLSTPKDTLFQLLSERGDPIAYYRKIVTEVCFDHSCRLLRVNLYWNVTGRYFGFELPPNEFLSKAEHEPFSPEEYQRLHTILADSLSPIGNLQYEDLMPKGQPDGLLDGVTGATSQDVLQYVVKGAVYTTYTTWNLIYGDTQNAVVQATEQALDADYLRAILNSGDLGDRYWALDRLRLLPDTATVMLQEKVLKMVCDDSYNLAAHIIEVLPDRWCADSKLQQALWSKFDCVQYALKPLLLKRISLCEQVDDAVLLGVADRLPLMNGPVLTAGLECLRKYLPENKAVLQRVTSLLHHKNRFVANQARKFLNEVTAVNP